MGRLAEPIAVPRCGPRDAGR